MSKNAIVKFAVVLASVLGTSQAMAQEFSWGISIHGNLKCYSSEHGFAIKGAYPVDPSLCTEEVVAYWHLGQCVPWVKGDSNKTDLSARNPIDPSFCE